MSDEQEPTPEEKAILDEAANIVSSASDAMDMEGLYAIMTRIGITITVWKNSMRNVQNPMPEEWINNAGMSVWNKFFPPYG